MITKTILITGARGGIGKDAAFELARRGYQVIATTETESEARELEKEVQQAKLSIICEKLDLLNESDRKKIEHWKPEILINNAGIGPSGPLAEIPQAALRHGFEVNVFSTIDLTQRALKSMLEKGSGRIIFITSVAGRIVVPFLGPYSMTKFALEAAADGLRQELAPHGIRVCVVEPGPIATGFNERMNASKYSWFKQGFFFWKEKKRIEGFEQSLVSNQKSTSSIVDAIVHAVEDQNPKTRVARPFRYSFIVALSKLVPDKVRDRIINRN